LLNGIEQNMLSKDQFLDESLASLDPVNSHRVLNCVEKHCKAVIIVAHP
jgi:ABC-type bacteriocin/lantibiotic exporter with double-glycine peptidase domain